MLYFLLANAWLFTQALVLAVVWALGKTFARVERVRELEREILVLKKDIDGHPSQEELHALEIQLVREKGRLQVIERQHQLLIEGLVRETQGGGERRV